MTQATSPSQLRLTWRTCQTNTWCALNTVDLDRGSLSKAGVYVIWYVSRKGNKKPVYVGQAKVIRERLEAHRDDEEIQDYATRHMLYVTWARVGAEQRDGVEVYLSQQLKPKVGEHYPDADPIAVNLPWH